MYDKESKSHMNSLIILPWIINKLEEKVQRLIDRIRVFFGVCAIDLRLNLT